MIWVFRACVFIRISFIVPQGSVLGPLLFLIYINNIGEELLSLTRLFADDASLGYSIKVITKLPNSEQSYKGKVQTHNYINRQNQSTTGKLWKRSSLDTLELVINHDLNKLSIWSEKWLMLINSDKTEIFKYGNTE